jgi:hypothetical protein
MSWRLPRALSGWLRSLRGSRPRWAGRASGQLDEHVAAIPAALPSSRSGSATADGPDVPTLVGRERLASARNDLRRLLDRHVATRAVWPSLALIERAMGKHGWAGIDRMSPQVLHDAATVLDDLTDERCDAGLIVLRARIATLLDVVFDDPSIAPPRHKARRPTETQVRDGSFTEFMEIDREWEQRLRAAPPGAAPPG